MTISRRSFIGAVGIGALASHGARAQQLRPTPQETYGPYYPVQMPAENDADLTRLAGRTGVAKGQLITLSGRVLRVDGSPVRDARIEIWQANAAGRYAHPVDRNPAPVDPDFQGVAVLKSNASGEYRIRSIKPGPYPTPGGSMRTPHIHFDVASANYKLVTQMYFPDEPLNGTDILISTMSGRERDPAAVICRRLASTESGVLSFGFDIVLL
jgi:protocatechuate 3,4-dioxygenase beta subunit